MRSQAQVVARMGEIYPWVYALLDYFRVNGHAGPPFARIGSNEVIESTSRDLRRCYPRVEIGVDKFEM